MTQPHLQPMCWIESIQVNIIRLALDYPHLQATLNIYLMEALVMNNSINNKSMLHKTTNKYHYFNHTTTPQNYIYKLDWMTTYKTNFILVINFITPFPSAHPLLSSKRSFRLTRRVLQNPNLNIIILKQIRLTHPNHKI